MKEVERILHRRKEVDSVFAVSGYSLTGNKSNGGIVFVTLAPLSRRHGQEHSVMSLVADLRGKLGAVSGAIVVPFLPPPIQGQGSTGGFTFELVDKGDSGFPVIASTTEQLIGAATKGGRVGGLFSTFSVDDPQLVVTIDREKAQSVGVSLTSINDALGVYLGAQYVNDFDFNNRSYRVFAQADAASRAQPDSMGKLYVRAASGVLLPLQGLLRSEPTTAPSVISHFNLFRSVEINGTPAPGVSSGQAIAAMDAAARQVLPPGMTSEWAGLSWEEVRAGSQTILIFGLALLFVYLVLSAQYESFALPVVILLAVPLALLGALGAQKLRGLVDDVYCQIGLVMLIGLAGKNAILIVEFAEQLRARGRSDLDAVVEAVDLRLRPILMTSIAFILGMLPLAIATGSGANSRRSLGTAVIGGLLLSTLLNLLFTPALYLTMRHVLGRVRRSAPAPQTPPLLPPHHEGVHA
jgi:HAE1 family hydrophobic/amphiphilic exporter-1